MSPRFDTQLVRDLYWALHSPMLIDHPCTVDPAWRRRETARYLGLLKKLDGRNSKLSRTLRRRDVNGVGEYFEFLIRTWLEEVPPARLAASNWQVYDGGRTVGEFDLLFYRDATLWHWELALKFYLGHPAPDGQFRWYGPDPSDRLDRKWAKMRGQQLRLHTHPAARRALNALNVEPDPTPRAFIKGYLFLPLIGEFDVHYPPDVNPYGLRGWWLHHRHLPSVQEHIDIADDTRWLILPPRRWMSQAFVTDGDRLHDFDDLPSVAQPNRPTLLAGLVSDDGQWREVTRGFAVPDGWPYF